MGIGKTSTAGRVGHPPIGESINNLGQAVGGWGSVESDPTFGPPVDVVLCPCFAVLWQNGQEIFLNELVPPEWNLLFATAINDKGHILAQAQLSDGTIESVVLLPIPLGTHNAASGAAVSRNRAASYTGPRALRKDHKGGVEAIW